MNHCWLITVLCDLLHDNRTDDTLQSNHDNTFKIRASTSRGQWVKQLNNYIRVQQEVGYMIYFVYPHYSDYHCDIFGLATNKHQRSGARLTKAYDVTIQRYRNSHIKIEDSKMHILRCMGSKFCVKFQRCPLKFHTKFWTHTSQNMHCMRC